MTQEMRRVVLETVIPSKFKYIARDLDGSIHVFENEPNLDYGTNKSPVPCDMWDVYEGETMQLSSKTPVSAGLLTEELGDWRDSCKELTELVKKDTDENAGDPPTTLQVALNTGKFYDGEIVVGSISTATYLVKNHDLDAFDQTWETNEDIETEADSLLDFSESNPFGDY